MLPLHEARERFEREYILRALAAQQGNISRTAEALGVERSNLYRKMRAFGIAPARRGESEGEERRSSEPKSDRAPHVARTQNQPLWSCRTQALFSST